MTIIYVSIKKMPPRIEIKIDASCFKIYQRGINRGATFSLGHPVLFFNQKQINDLYLCSTQSTVISIKILTLHLLYVLKYPWNINLKLSCKAVQLSQHLFFYTRTFLPMNGRVTFGLIHTYPSKFLQDDLSCNFLLYLRHITIVIRDNIHLEIACMNYAPHYILGV